MKIMKSCGDSDWIRSTDLLKRLDVTGEYIVRAVAKKFLAREYIPDPYSIEIETFNRCNNNCSFCPVNRNDDTRKPQFMSEDLLDNVLQQLKAMDYHGYIALFSNNEPLLDERILSFIEKARKFLPNAYHHLYTNGILLDDEKFLFLVKYLDRLFIDNYDDDFRLIPSVKKIIDAKLDETWKCEVVVDLRKKNQKLMTRAGSSPNRRNEKMYSANSPCILPFTQMVIRPDGKVIKCCNDPLTDMVMGDLNKESLREIWHGENYRKFRKDMLGGERKSIKGCQFCDVFGLYNFLPPYIKESARDSFVFDISWRRNLSEIYVFDTIPLSKLIAEELKRRNIPIHGYINIRGQKLEDNEVRLDAAIKNKGFIVIPTPKYSDEIFDVLSKNKYTYNVDYVICPENVF